MEVIYSLITWLPGLVITLVIMSMTRAQVANLLGDPTPRRMGLLSRNPIDHMDPIGTLAVPAMLALVQAPVFGWGKGFIIDSDNFRRPRMDAAVVALSGPVVALFVGALAAVVLSLAGPDTGDGPMGPLLAYFWACIGALLVTSCVLAVFNLLPIPGFDGGLIVEALLPKKLADDFAALRQYSLLVLVALVVIMPMLSPELDIIRRLVLPLAMGIAQFFLWGAGVTG